MAALRCHLLEYSLLIMFINIGLSLSSARTRTELYKVSIVVLSRLFLFLPQMNTDKSVASFFCLERRVSKPQRYRASL